MSDRIDELVQQVMDVFAHSQNPETDEWELSGDLDQYPSYVALTELATIAREAEASALTWQLTTENIQKLLNEATARALKAEAMCAWLAERLEESDDTVLAADTWLVAAREAVKS